MKKFTYHIRPDSTNPDRFTVAFSMNNMLEKNDPRRKNPMVLYTNASAHEAIKFAKEDAIDRKNTEIIVEF